MTPKREKILWTVYGLVLILLFLISSTDVIMKEKEPEIYPISIIIDDTTDDFYVNFKKGVDQAAIDYHADVSFITLYDKTRTDQQLELVSREVNDGARAVILSPLDESALLLAMDETMINGPFVVINSPLSHVKVSCNITEDYGKAGETLAENIVRRTGKTTPVYLIAESMAGFPNMLIQEGMMSVFQENGYEVQTVEVKSEEECRKFLNEVMGRQKETALAALDVETLLRISRTLEEQEAYQTYTSGVYGFGSTLQILNYLDKGVIDGLVVTNDFIRGYLSIQKAVEAIQNVGIHQTVEIPHYYVEQKNLRDKEFQKILYPLD